MTSISERVKQVKHEIELACKKCGRSVEEVTLVAVSKGHSVSSITEAIRAGLSVFGENKVQEAETKISQIGKSVEWHLIGHLQSNKARKAVRLFNAIHSIDSIRIAAILERICKEEGRAELPVFIQLNLAKEETKSGISEGELPELIEFVKSCERLRLKGLMTLPPFFEDAEKVRPFFRRLRELRDKFLPEGKLSMGMSHDFTVAIEEGASHVRIGTRIFGERNL